jgi:hypothetical protein
MLLNELQRQQIQIERQQDELAALEEAIQELRDRVTGPARR